MNKINKVRKGEVRIYKGMTYVAVPEIKEDHCTGCCFYIEGLPHVDIEFYKQKIINFVKWI